MANCLFLENLKFSHAPKQSIIDIDQFEMNSGEKLFLFGPSGCGKSTLLGLISGVLRPQSGTIKVLQQDYGLLGPSEKDKFRGGHIGYIFQSFNLLPYLTITENIMLPCLVNKMRKSKVSGPIHEEATHLAVSLGLADHINKTVDQLSIGQQQRVAAARALIGGPEIVIADEPTSSLDEENTESFMKLLMKEQEQKGFGLLFVSHDQRLKTYFDRSLSLKEINKAGLDA